MTLLPVKGLQRVAVDLLANLLIVGLPHDLENCEMSLTNILKATRAAMSFAQAIVTV